MGIKYSQTLTNSHMSANSMWHIHNAALLCYEVINT